jgi:hypothetical protein
VDQIVYQDSGGRPHLLGVEGVGPVATSLSPEDLAVWDRNLRKRLPDDPSYEYPSLCYLEEHAGKRALLYRTLRGENRTSGFAHVLIGASSDLPPAVALGAWRWDWRGAISPNNVEQLIRPADGRRLDPVTQNGLADLAGRASQEMARLKEISNSDLAFHRVVIQVLSQPEMPEHKFAIIAEPGEQRVVILAGFLSWVDETFLADGFSTHELRYNDGLQGLPRFIFTNRRQRHSSFPVSRIRVDLSREILVQSVDEGRAQDVADAAAILATAYRRGDSPTGNVAALLAGRPAKGVTEQTSRWLLSILDEDLAPAWQRPDIPKTTEPEQGAGQDLDAEPGPASEAEAGPVPGGQTEQDGHPGLKEAHPAGDSREQAAPREEPAQPQPDRVLIELAAFTLAMNTLPQDACIRLRAWASGHGVPDGDVDAFRDCLRKQEFRPEFIPQQTPDSQSYVLGDYAVTRLTDIAYPGLPASFDHLSQPVKAGLSPDGVPSEQSRPEHVEPWAPPPSRDARQNSQGPAALQVGKAPGSWQERTSPWPEEQGDRPREGEIPTWCLLLFGAVVFLVLITVLLKVGST